MIALRIGGFQTVENAMHERSANMADAWVTERDLTQLIQRCIDNESLKFAIRVDQLI